MPVHVQSRILVHVHAELQRLSPHLREKEQKKLRSITPKKKKLDQVNNKQGISMKHAQHILTYSNHKINLSLRPYLSKKKKKIKGISTDSDTLTFKTGNHDQ
jgi:DNA-binding transcriptional MocR family regulator